MQITLAFVFLILGGLTFYWVRSRHLAYLAEAKRLNDEFEAMSRLHDAEMKRINDVWEAELAPIRERRAQLLEEERRLINEWHNLEKTSD